MTILNHYVIALSSSSISFFLLALIVYLNNPKKKKINVIFSFYSLSIGVWSMGQAFCVSASSEASALFWARFFHAGVIFISTTFIHFTYTLLGFTGKRHKKVLFTLYTLSLVFLVLDMTPLYIPSVVAKKFSLNFYWKIGPAYILFLVFWVGTVIYGLYELFNAYSNAKGVRRNQLAYFCWSTLAGYIGGSGNYLPAFNLHIYPFNPFGTYAAPLYMIIISYTIIRYRLMDIRLIIKDTTIHILSALAISITFITLGLNFFSRPTMIIMIILTAIASSLFFPFLKRLLQPIIYGSRYQYQKTISRFSKELVSILQMDELLKTTIDTIVKAMGLEKGYILLLDEQGVNYSPRSSYGLIEMKNLSLAVKDRFIDWLRQQNDIVVKEDLERNIVESDVEGKMAIEKMRQIEVDACVPMIIKGNLIGLITLGNKSTGDIYNTEDVELLTTLANQLSIAIENATAYNKIENLNQELAQKMQELTETQEYLLKSEKINLLGELAFGLGHELRNPFMCLQGCLDMITWKIEDLKLQGASTSEIMGLIESGKKECLRVGSIIDNLRDFAKPGQAESVDINEIIERSLELVQHEIKMGNIEIIKDIPPVLPKINGSLVQYEQVFINLIRNACQAMETKKESKLYLSVNNYAQDHLAISVKDTGSGISAKELSRLFGNFYTTKKDGMGMGLYMSNRIIKAFNGRIEVNSDEGEGCTFTVILPLKSV
ncbi:MAG: ATP-binding protein [bacterium]